MPEHRVALRQARRAVDCPGVHPQGARTVRRTSRLHPHHRTAAGDGAGGGPVHVVDAGVAGPAQRRYVAGAVARTARDGVAVQPQHLPRLGRGRRAGAAAPSRWRLRAADLGQRTNGGTRTQARGLAPADGGLTAEPRVANPLRPGRLGDHMVVIAQQVEHQVVILAVGGSSPLGHPKAGPDRVQSDESLGTLSGRLLL